MKREFLTELGLEKDAIDKIMAENGKDINAEKEKTTAAESARDTLQTTLDEANETIKGFKAKDPDVTKAQDLAAEWENKYKAAEKARAAEAKNNALMQELAKTGTVDAELVKACLNMDEIIIKDGKIIGLDDQITGLKENKPYLFAEPAKPQIKGAHLGEGSDVPPGGEPIDISKMTYSQMVDYIKQHPESASMLYGKK